MRVYISGKITGTNDYLDRFEIAEVHLILNGIDVINPAKTNATLPRNMRHEEYMHICYAMMDVCDAIMFLNGWEDSKGAKLEYDYAVRCKLPIFFEGEILDENKLIADR